MRHLFILSFLALTACSVSEDSLEPNDDVAHATSLPIGATREAIVILGNDDLYTTTPGAATTLRWHLVPTGREKEARIALVGADGVVPEIPLNPACNSPDAPLPRVVCADDGSFDLDAAVAEGESAVVVVHQPALCGDCFTPESTTYTLSVDRSPASP
jgi:hypothetical protein